MKYIFILFFFFSCLYAHKLNIYAYEENNTIFIHGYFSKSAPCKSCNVQLLTIDGALIYESTSDEKGKLQVEKTWSQDLHTIVMNASMGHKNQIEFLSKGNKERLTLPEKSIYSLAIFIAFFGLLIFFKRSKA